MQTKHVSLYGALALAALFALSLGLWLGRPARDGAEVSPPSVPRIARALLVLQDGRLCPKSGGPPFTGIIYEKTSTGRLLTELQAVDGKVHGVARGWHENGQLEVEETFENGVSHGVRVRWHANGRKRSTTTIDHGTLQGPFTEWHDNGQTALKMNLVDGKGEGLCEAWHADGTLKSKVMLKGGEPVKKEYFTSAAP